MYIERVCVCDCALAVHAKLKSLHTGNLSAYKIHVRPTRNLSAVDL